MSATKHDGAKKVKRFDHDIELRTCHDIRKLAGCSYCGGMGWAKHMVPVGSGRSKEHLHGRCYIALNGMDAFLVLRKEVTDQLFLSDIGNKAMRALMNR
jgi:hypothetical protein